MDAARLHQQDLLVPLPAGEGGPAAAVAVAFEVRESAQLLERLAGETPGIPGPVVLRMDGLSDAVLFALQAGTAERCLRFAATGCVHGGHLWLRVRVEIEAPAVRTRVWTGWASVAASFGGIGAILAGLWLPGFALLTLGLVAGFASRLATGGLMEHDRWRADPALGEAAATLLSRLAALRSGMFVRRDQLG